MRGMTGKRGVPPHLPPSPTPTGSDASWSSCADFAECPPEAGGGDRRAWGQAGEVRMLGAGQGVADAILGLGEKGWG